MGHNSRKMQRPSCRAHYVAGIELAGESKEPRNPGRQGPSSPSGGRGTPTLGDFLPPDRLHKHKWAEQAGLPPPAPESRTFHRLPPPNKQNRNPQTPQSKMLQAERPPMEDGTPPKGSLSASGGSSPRSRKSIPLPHNRPFSIHSGVIQSNPLRIQPTFNRVQSTINQHSINLNQVQSTLNHPPPRLIPSPLTGEGEACPESLEGVRVIPLPPPYSPSPYIPPVPN